MKLICLTAILILFYSSPALSRHKKPEAGHVSVLSVKREVFYFKVSKQFLGATVEVLNKAGETIYTEKITKRKTILDFFHWEAGTYTIKITKGELVEEFECAFNFR